MGAFAVSVWFRWVSLLSLCGSDGYVCCLCVVPMSKFAVKVWQCWLSLLRYNVVKFADYSLWLTDKFAVSEWQCWVSLQSKCGYTLSVSCLNVVFWVGLLSQCGLLCKYWMMSSCGSAFKVNLVCVICMSLWTSCRIVGLLYKLWGKSCKLLQAIQCPQFRRRYSIQ